ncbi:MAG: hypothetical protein ACJAWO_001173, partial [Halieaceae bacterium]
QNQVIMSFFTQRKHFTQKTFLVIENRLTFAAYGGENK